MRHVRQPCLLLNISGCAIYLGVIFLFLPVLISTSDEVNRLFKMYKENRDMLQAIGQRYVITYPTQLRNGGRRHTLSTKVQPVTKLERDGEAVRGALYKQDSRRHVERTSIVIKAFSHQFQVDLQLNKQLLAPNLIHKHYLQNGAEQISKQELEHCYYHGQVRDYPGAVAAMRTCNGISGVIQIGNETFVIHPFYGGDMSTQHPHVVYESRSGVHQACANTRLFEMGMRNYRDTSHKAEMLVHAGNHSEQLAGAETVLPGRRSRNIAADAASQAETSVFSSDGRFHGDDVGPTPSRNARDVRSVTKHIEMALVLDKAMFDSRNASTRESVIHDAVQIVNIADQYYKTLNTRISLVYIETWSAENQASVSSSDEIRLALLNFKEYGSQHLFKIARDTTHLLSGVRFKFDKTGMAVPGQICNENSYGVTVDNSVYTPHVTASTMAHVLGHVIGMAHDDREGCACSDWHGCIMSATIVGKDNVQPYKFSQCSRNDYIKELQRSHGLCLFNRPNELQRRKCGNGVVEEGEDCDCGSVDDEQCRQMDPCCDHITCKLRPQAECATGPCCHNCKLRRRGTLCRRAANECDVPEFCTGSEGSCPADVHKSDGYECAEGRGYCFRGGCPSRNEQCAQIWGYNSVASHDQCYQRFNTQGFINGHCGNDRMGRFKKCSSQDVLCGLLQCQLGYPDPVIASGGDGVDQTVSRTVISVRGQEYHCNVASGNIQAPTEPNHGMVKDGTRCGDGRICVNHTCSFLQRHVTRAECPDNGTHQCSGNGVCTNENTCFCFAGFSGESCSIRTNGSYPGMNFVPHRAPPSAQVTDKPKKRVLDTIDTNARTTSLVKSDGSSTLHLVITLVSLVGMIFIAFTFVALCYRRRSTLPKYGINIKSKHSLQPKPMTVNSGGAAAPSRHLTAGSSDHLEASRMITFGPMPSYSASFPRDHKLVQQRLQPYIGGASDAMSNGQRNYATAQQMAATTPPGSSRLAMSQLPPQMAPLVNSPSAQLARGASAGSAGPGAQRMVRPHALSSRPMDPLDDGDGFLASRPGSQPKTPERGILKKCGSGAIYGSLSGSGWPDESHSEQHENSSVSDNNADDSDANGQVTEVERTLKSLNGYHEDILEALRNAAGARTGSCSSYSDELQGRASLNRDCFCPDTLHNRGAQSGSRKS